MAGQIRCRQGDDGQDGGSGGARTRHKSNKDGPFEGVPSQIASQRAGFDLCKVINAWPDLPPALKAAILAIVNSATEAGGK